MAIFYIFIYLIRIDNYVTLYHIPWSKYSQAALVGVVCKK